MTEVTRRFQWSMGHTLFEHEGACRNLHGHNYVALVTCTAPTLDEVGRVIDFGLVKQLVGAVIQGQMDHRFVLYAGDPRAPELLAIDEYVVTWRHNPTAENIAAYLFDQARAVLSPTGVKVTKVRVWETENCYADFTG